ncbi:carbonic anhydrase family protein [Pseudomonas citronellolis]|uniref:carbonic anhydrase family protein n=1 Tax=Pseudomonas citronellolis TaxID=53408 RepID=UPI0023E36609|nr:carbonic anhydrase family protein [Pseudomonas citronellolis]MDF3933497.1 carbonic anhydrase family protein [Pseudomonas citronellolis]
MHDRPCCTQPALENPRRRSLLLGGAGLAALGLTAGAGWLGAPGEAEAAALSRAERDALSPAQVIERLKQGNERFRSGRMRQYDYLAQKRASSGGQYPAAVILSCIDSRAPAEILFDMGIADSFSARVAGNVVNDDLLGSLEFACAASGAKVVLVMGHTACGAIKGAIDGAQLGHLTGLLKKIEPALAATEYPGERSARNPAYVDAVARTHVRLTLERIRRDSPVLAKLEAEGRIRLAGSLYHLQGGEVEFFA